MPSITQGKWVIVGVGERKNGRGLPSGLRETEVAFLGNPVARGRHKSTGKCTLFPPSATRDTLFVHARRVGSASSHGGWQQGSMHGAVFQQDLAIVHDPAAADGRLVHGDADVDPPAGRGRRADVRDVREARRRLRRGQRLHPAGRAVRRVHRPPRGRELPAGLPEDARPRDRLRQRHPRMHALHLLRHTERDVYRPEAHVLRRRGVQQPSGDRASRRKLRLQPVGGIRLQVHRDGDQRAVLVHFLRRAHRHRDARERRDRLLPMSAAA